MAVSPDGTHVYVTKYTSTAQHGVSVIDTATNTVSATIPVGELPTAVAVSPDGTYVYVTNDGGGTLSVIDTAHQHRSPPSPSAIFQARWRSAQTAGTPTSLTMAP